jgi:hypothetical protein
LTVSTGICVELPYVPVGSGDKAAIAIVLLADSGPPPVNPVPAVNVIADNCCVVSAATCEVVAAPIDAGVIAAI